MSWLNEAPPLIATGTIAPSRFVMVDTANDLSCLQATNGAAIVGISQVGTDLAPGVNSTSNAATSGETPQLFGLGSICLLSIGSASITAGDYLGSDANGQGIAQNTAGHIGARALESATSGQLCLVERLCFHR